MSASLIEMEFYWPEYKVINVPPLYDITEKTTYNELISMWDTLPWNLKSFKQRFIMLATKEDLETIKIVNKRIYWLTKRRKALAEKHHIGKRNNKMKIKGDLLDKLKYLIDMSLRLELSYNIFWRNLQN